MWLLFEYTVIMTPWRTITVSVMRKFAQIRKDMKDDISMFVFLSTDLILLHGVFVLSRATHMFRQCSDKKQFRFYMVYAWGLSLLLTLVVVVLGYTRPFPDNLLPGVDINTCFLRSM